VYKKVIGTYANFDTMIRVTGLFKLLGCIPDQLCYVCPRLVSAGNNKLVVSRPSELIRTSRLIGARFSEVMKLRSERWHGQVTIDGHVIIDELNHTSFIRPNRH
jgi:hypothetical protein